MDIPLQEEEDTSDEEYCPDEDEEDETTEEVHITLTSYLKKMIQILWFKIIIQILLFTMLGCRQKKTL